MEKHFQRARRPEQKEQRRIELLATAEAMLRDRGDVRAVSLNELARRSGMAKSNVYRYFESREAVLLELLWRQWEAWFDELERSLEARADRQPSLEQLASVFARVTASRPLLCHLTSALPSVLEHNLSAERIRWFKLGARDFIADLARYLHGRIPEFSTERYERLIHHAITLMAGLWPFCNPSPAVREVLGAPELADFRHDFERDLEELVRLLARGMAGER